MIDGPMTIHAFAHGLIVGALLVVCAFGTYRVIRTAVTGEL